MKCMETNRRPPLWWAIITLATHPISFLPCHWPSLNNESCWLKGFSVLSAWVMDTPPVLFHPPQQHWGKCLCRGVETYTTANKDRHWHCIPPLFSSGNWLQAFQLFTLLNNVGLHLYLSLSWLVILIWRLSNGRVNGRWQDFNRKSLSLFLDV